MRLTLWVLGCEVFAVALDRPQPESEEHDHLAAQVERADSAPIGFYIEPNPSVSSTQNGL